MKAQFSLRFKLILQVVAVLFFIAVGFLALFAWLTSRYEDRVIEAVVNGSTSNARLVGEEIAYDLVTMEEAELAKNIKKHAEAFEQQGRNVRGIYVFNQGGEKAYFLGEHPFEEFFPEGYDFKVLKEDRVELQGESARAIVSVRSEGETVGYLVLVESIAQYQEFGFHMVFLTGGLFLAFVGLVAVLFWASGRISAPINSISSTARRIAEGDLSNIRTDKVGVTETDELGDSVTVMATALRNQVVATNDLTVESAKVSVEVAQAMAHLASSAAQQAAAVAETASTVEEMEKAGKSASQHARQIVEAAEKSTEASIRGLKAVDTTNDIIMQIKDDSQEISGKAKTLLAAVEEIGNIIRSVNAIAEQSKILAVNASIEAAKAGEYGSGFAVVAQEVKDLAQQSKDATQQITQTLTAIRKAIEDMVTMSSAGEARTEQGVKMVANAGAIVNDLSEAIRENSEFANIINTAVTQQTLGLTQIATAIEEINASATENQDISRNIERGTRDMTASLEKLADLVGAWRTGDVQLGGREPTGLFKGGTEV